MDGRAIRRRRESAIGQAEVLELEAQFPRTQVAEFNSQLYGVLVSLFDLGSEPMEIVRNSAKGMGPGRVEASYGEVSPEQPTGQSGAA